MTEVAWESRWGPAAIRILWAIAATFVVARFLWLDSDPSGFLGPDFLTDEGWYSQNARSHYLFGEWVMDDHNVALVLCPLHTLALRASYAVFGVSFWSTRVVGAVASALTVAVVGRGLRRNPLAAALAAALVASQPILFALSRVAFAESLQLLFVTLVWFLGSIERPTARSWMLTGIAAGLAITAKASALYAPVLALAAPWLTREEHRGRRWGADTVWVLAGGGLVLLGLVAFESGFAAQFLAETGREGSVAGFPGRGIYLPFLVGLTEVGGNHPGFWVGVFPLLAIATVLAGRLLLTQPVDGHADGRVRLAVAWIGLSLLAFGSRRAPPLAERYWANLLVPLAIVLALGGERRHEGPSPLGRLRTWAAAMLMVVGPALVLRSGARLEFAPAAPAVAYPLRALVFVTIALLVVLAVLAAWAKLPQWLAQSAFPWTAVAIAVAVGSAVASVSTLVVPTFTIRDTSRALAEPGVSKVLTGDVGNTFSLETPYRAFVCRDLAQLGLGTGWVNGDWRAMGATHWIATGPPNQEARSSRPVPGAEIESTWKVWPDVTGNSRFSIHVYRLPRDAG